MPGKCSQNKFGAKVHENMHELDEQTNHRLACRAMRKFVILILVAGLAASGGASGCYYDIYVNACWDWKAHGWRPTDGYVDPDNPNCCYDPGVIKGRACGKPDAGADACTDAGAEGESDAGSDDAGPPADEVCPWACTPVGGAGFDPFPSYVWFGEEDAMPPPPLGVLKLESWVDVDLKTPKCPTCSCIAPTNPSDGCVLPTCVKSLVVQPPAIAPCVTE
jgi:hypothetical protein